MTLTIPGTEQRTAQVNGWRMHYVVAGEGEPLVLVHGIAAFCFSWRLVMPKLAERYRVYAPDFLGLGSSERPQNLSPSLSDVADRLRQFVESVELRSAHFVASSHGGSVLMRMAAQSPQCVRSMVLVSPPNPFAQGYRETVRLWQTMAGRLFARLIPHLPDAAHGYVISRMYGDRRRMPKDTGCGYGWNFRQPGTVRFIQRMMETIVKDIDELKADLHKIGSVPMLWLWGDADPVVEPSTAYDLQRELPTSRVEMLPGVGHLPYEETPDQFTSAVLRFLESQQAGTTGATRLEQRLHGD